MAHEIRLPQLSQVMQDCTVLSILIEEGSEINIGDIILEIETDKATLEFESPQAGFVKKIFVKSGQIINVDSLIAIIGEKDEVISDNHVLTQQSPDTGANEIKDTQDVPQGKTASRKEPYPTAAGNVAIPDNIKIVRLPQISQTMQDAVIVSLLAQEGSYISQGEILLEIETDKATLELESPYEGYIKKFIALPGDTVAVGSALAIIAGQNDVVPQELLDSFKQPAQAEASSDSVSMNSQSVAQSHSFADLISDVLSETRSIRLGGRIPLTRMQKITSQKMIYSKQNIPCFYLNIVVDVTDLVEYRKKLNESSEIKVSFNDFIMKALALAILEYPVMAGQIKGDSIQISDTISVGLAIAVDQGLMAPVCKYVDKKTIFEVAAYNKDLIDRAKAGKILPEDFADGCITLSNLGAFGVESFIPIVVPGQCSILGVGSIRDVCVPDSADQITTRKQMTITLSVDHQVANGADAAQFLDRVKKILENPSIFN